MRLGKTGDHLAMGSPLLWCEWCSGTYDTGGVSLGKQINSTIFDVVHSLFWCDPVTTWSLDVCERVAGFERILTNSELALFLLDKYDIRNVDNFNFLNNWKLLLPSNPFCWLQTSWVTPRWLSLSKTFNLIVWQGKG